MGFLFFFYLFVGIIFKVEIFINTNEIKVFEISIYIFLEILKL